MKNIISNTIPVSTILRALLLIICAAHGVPVEAQSRYPQPRVSLVTCAPGKEIYQLEGHEALRIQLPGGEDIAVNWGVFDFDSPNFVYRFVKGETDYMAVAYPFSLFLAEYSKEGRQVVEQQLNLTPAQTERLLDLVENNLKAENRTYRYNYVKDNCSTRPLALVEQAVGMPIEIGIPDEAEPVTFRSEMTSYHTNYPWYQFGIDIALGSGIDYPIDQRERTFAPVRLATALESASFVSPSGEHIPVVTSTQTLLDGAPTGVQADATPWPLTPFAIGVDLLVITLLISFYDCRHKQLSRWFDSLLYGVQFLAGCLLTFLIFISVHEATSPNWLYLWLNPLCIISAAGIWIKSWKRVVYWYQICNFAALIVLLSVHEWFGQAFNAAFPLYIACSMIRSLTDIYILGRTLSRKSVAKQDANKS